MKKLLILATYFCAAMTCSAESTDKYPLKNFGQWDVFKTFDRASGGVKCIGEYGLHRIEHDGDIAVFDVADGGVGILGGLFQQFDDHPPKVYRDGRLQNGTILLEGNDLAEALNSQRMGFNFQTYTFGGIVGVIGGSIYLGDMKGVIDFMKKECGDY